MDSHTFLLILERLEPRHRRALRWFVEHTGQVVPWPKGLADGTLLVSRPKGIYKPRWSNYALSVRQTLEGPYPDRPIEHNPDGSWSYEYFQENLELSERDNEFTNRGLLECWKDVVPVGVMIQTSGKPRVRYHVIGLALVTGYDQGRFYLEGLSNFAVHAAHPRPPIPSEIPAAELVALGTDLRRVQDERRKTLREIAVRQGQQGFRAALLDAYENRCALTDYDAPKALEAAHIVPYRGAVTNHPSNGLLLRGDIHTLFDLGLIAISPDDSTVVLSRKLVTTKYEPLAGRRLRTPQHDRERPSRTALRLHFEGADL